MGRLTDEMAQLRGDIDSSRASRLAQQNQRVSNVSRQISEFSATRMANSVRDAKDRANFVADNSNSINQTLNDFRKARELMGKQGRDSRKAFTSNMAKDTSDLLKGFNADRRSMAESSAKDRADFTKNLSNTVAAFINEAAQDRAGAHAAFFGTSTAKKKTHHG